MTSVQLKSESREFIRLNAPKLLLVGIVYLIVLTLISELQFRLPAPVSIYEQLRLGYITIEQFSNSIRRYGLLLALILGLMLPTISTGYKYYCLKITRKQDGDYKDLLTGLYLFNKVISISVITTVIIFFWSLLFIVPGIIAAYKYRQVYYILLDDPSKSPMHCINESKHLMHGKKLELFLIDISFIFWYILNVFIMSFVIPIFPVVSIWLTPYYGLTQASYYNYLIKEVTV